MAFSVLRFLSVQFGEDSALTALWRQLGRPNVLPDQRTLWCVIGST